MSVSINLSGLFANAGGTAADPLAVIFASLSGAATGAASSGGDPLAALSTAERDQTADIAATAKQPAVQRDIVAFTQAVAAAKTPADLLANPIALRVLLTANGLGDQTGYAALAQKALLSDPSVSTSLANQLSATNAAWLSTAKTYQFATQGLSVIQQPTVVSTITQAYAEVTWRQSLDATTPGLSKALSFRAIAGTVTSVDQILGDATLRDVVLATLSIPEQIAFQSLAAQEQAITSQLNIADFKSASFVESFTQRYLLSQQQTSASAGSDLGALAVRAQGLIV